MEALCDRYFATVMSRKLAVSTILDKLLSYCAAMNTVLLRYWRIDDRTSGNVFFMLTIDICVARFKKEEALFDIDHMLSAHWFLDDEFAEHRMINCKCDHSRVLTNLKTYDRKNI